MAKRLPNKREINGNTNNVVHDVQLRGGAEKEDVDSVVASEDLRTRYQAKTEPDLLHQFTDGSKAPMSWIPIAGAVAGVATFLVILVVFLFAYRKIRSRRLANSKLTDNGLGKDTWVPTNYTQPNFRTIKCIPSISRSDDSGDSEDIHGKDFAGTHVAGGTSVVAASKVQPSFHEPLRRQASTSSNSSKRRGSSHGSHGSSPIDGSSKASDDDENEDAAMSKGKIWFSAKFNAIEGLLYIEILKAKYLKGRSMFYSPRDPFVRVYLLPDETNYFQTKVKHRTFSPKFKETFTFELDIDNACSRSLKFVVYDFDKKSVRHSLGHAIVPLAKIDLTTGNPVSSELDDCPQKVSYVGEILLNLNCNPYTDKVKATIVRLKNLPVKSNGKIKDVYIKVELFHGRRLLKAKRSLIHPGASVIEVQETFSYSVSGRHLDSCSICVTIVVRTRGTSREDQPIGKLVVGPFMFARGRELLHWQEMLCNPRTSVEKWHQLCDVT